MGDRVGVGVYGIQSTVVQLKRLIEVSYLK